MLPCFSCVFAVRTSTSNTIINIMIYLRLLFQLSLFVTKWVGCAPLMLYCFGAIDTVHPEW